MSDQGHLADFDGQASYNAKKGAVRLSAIAVFIDSVKVTCQEDPERTSKVFNFVA